MERRGEPLSRLALLCLKKRRKIAQSSTDQLVIYLTEKARAVC
jgi:hypothetical protein